MFKGANRFLQSQTSASRSLSDYSRKLKLRSGQSRLIGQGQFEAGTAYIKQISPLIHHFWKNGLAHSAIVNELNRRGIATPSGNPWTAALAAELIETIRLSDKKHPKRVHRARSDFKKRR
jgi:hypothetical protein